MAGTGGGFGGQRGGVVTPPPLGGIGNDLNTLFHDLMANADPAQLKADLTTLRVDLAHSNFTPVDLRPVTAAAIDFLQTRPTIFGPATSS